MSKIATIKGEVIQGKQLGRSLGFPTANLNIGSDVKAKQGVWLVEIVLEGVKYHGVANLGTRPTIDNNTQMILEVNIFNFNQNIYKKEIEISLLHHIRTEKKFKSLVELKSRVEMDIEIAKNLISKL